MLSAFPTIQEQKPYCTRAVRTHFRDPRRPFSSRKATTSGSPCRAVAHVSCKQAKRSIGHVLCTQWPSNNPSPPKGSRKHPWYEGKSCHGLYTTDIPVAASSVRSSTSFFLLKRDDAPGFLVYIKQKKEKKWKGN